jgi:glycyl-tRNA synthetase beta chain
MRVHQKYFSCTYPDGRPAPHFLFVANNLAQDGGKAIIAGNERVLRARLADARFFWDQDRKIQLEDRLKSLEDRVYYGGLAKFGERADSVYEKTFRVRKMAEFLARNIGADQQLASRAGLLSKADLSTGMVGEFPELQGVMGRHYALHGGEPREVADAIAEHYKPLGPDDPCPRAPVSVAVALADKIDSLVGFFAIGEKPTGSRDPFALRRAALGAVRLILENRLRMGLANVLEESELTYSRERITDLFEGDPPRPALPPTLKEDVLAFIAERLRVHLRERGVRHDLVAAVFALAEDDLWRLTARVDALTQFLVGEDGANLLVAYRRASNIVTIEAKKGGWDGGEVNRTLLDLPEEEALAESLLMIGNRVVERLDAERFEDAMAELARLRQPVDEFFEKVTVNTDDAKLRENRLRLLARIRATMNQVADFSLIEG